MTHTSRHLGLCIIITIVVVTVTCTQYKLKVEFMEMLQEKQVNYEDDINMTLSVIKHDRRYKNAGDRARQWLLHYFNYQRQVASIALPVLPACHSLALDRGSY